MKKLLLILLACFTFSTSALASQVNLNSATGAELEALKGVGPVKAKSIVDYRAKNGPFNSVDDLELVPGFGKKTVDKLRVDLTVSGSAAPSGAEGRARPTVRKDADSAKVAKKDVSKTAAGRK